MKITVQRSGGIAGMKRTWSVLATPPDDKDFWQPLVEACPWDEAPKTAGAAAGAQPDRFLYSIRAGQRQATLPEQAVTGPWRELVDHARAAAESIPDESIPEDPGGRTPPGGLPPSEGLSGPLR
ncbi:protealysin inhibitor emfourin [Arthrobacter sp. UYCu723]